MFAVGTTKLWVMILASLGWYAIYWFERQYRFQKRANDEDTMPLGRAIFSIFCASSSRRCADYFEKMFRSHEPFPGLEARSLLRSSRQRHRSSTGTLPSTCST